MSTYYRRKVIQEECIYYCKECNKLYKECYELEGVDMCVNCFSDDIKVIPKEKITAFIRKKRLQKLKGLYE